MLRRLISAMAITAAAALAPATAAAADEYGPSEFPCDITFDSTTVTVGETFGFTISCPELAGTTITLQIAFAGEAAAADQAVEVAGADAESLTLDEDGTVYDTAVVSAAGDYTAQVFDADGDPLSEVYTITAVTAGGGGGLAATGPTSLPYLVVAGGLLVLGVGALVTIRVRARRG